MTREQLRAALWPADTFVDYELGLNTAVKKLRQALEDTADHPRFIETLPKRGYRFVAPVEWVPEITNQDALHIVIPIVRSGREPYTPDSKTNTIHWLKRKTTIAIATCIVTAGLFYTLAASRVERVWRLYELQQLKVVPLTALPGEVSSPTFSPDGSQVAFVWDGGNGAQGSDVYVKVIGNDNPLRLTHHGDAFAPAWSPDGKNIAFRRGNGLLTLGSS